MITVSDGFKKAIKNANRQIFGYVDVKYQEDEYNKSVSTIPTKLDIYDTNSIINGNKIMKKYATLEENYTLLDNSFILYNENNLDKYGYASDDVFEDINDATITITNNSTSKSIKGITIYFRDNLPFDFTVTFTDTNSNQIVDNITNNTSMKYQYVFTSDIFLDSVTIEIERVEFPKNRLRIAYIDFNISDLFEGNELVNFDVTEELDLLMENLPINTCTINLNNYPDSNGANRFDIINPRGITKYLTDNSTIEPYIGVLTEDNGIEYVQMGTFYLDNWSSNPNGNVTFNGKSVLSKLQGMIIPNTGGFFNLQSVYDLGEYLTSNTGYSFGFRDSPYGFNNNELQINDLLKYLQTIFLISLTYISGKWYDLHYFKVNRENQILFDDLNQTIVDNIDRTSLINDAQYINKNKIKEIIYKKKSQGGLYTDAQTQQIIDDTHIMNSDIEYVWYSVSSGRTLAFGSSVSISYSVSSGSATATLIDYNNYRLVVKYEGVVGSQISVTCSTTTRQESRTIDDSVVIINKDGLDTINIDTTSLGYYPPYYNDMIREFYKNMDKQYKVKVDTNGDPSLEIGDSINIQTRYKEINDGYKTMIITKQKFTFNGGLKCSIEGVGD